MIKTARLAITFFFFPGAFLLHAQVPGSIPDSAVLARQRVSDSLRAIPLKLISSGDYGDIRTLDSNEFVIRSYHAFGKSVLNNIGSPVNEERETSGFIPLLNYGYRNLDFFTQLAQERPFIRSNKTYSELMVSEGLFFSNSTSGLIDNLNASAVVAKNFANHIDLNVIYDRINQKGIYQNSRNLLGRLSAGLQYRNPKSRWSYGFYYVNHLFRIENNGGIVDDSLLSSSRFQVREAIPVYTDRARTDIRGNQYRGVVSWVISTSSGLRPQIFAEADYQNWYNTFSDQRTGSQSLYGASFRMDSNGLLRTMAMYSTPFVAGLRMNPGQQTEAEISYHYTFNHLIEDSTYRRDLNVSVWHAGLHWSRGSGRLGIIADIKSQQSQALYRFTVDGNLPFNKILKFQWRATFANDLASIMQQHLYVNKRSIRVLDAQKIQTLDLSAGLHFTNKYLPSLELGWTQFDKLIYATAADSIRQSDQLISRFNIALTEDFQWRFLGTTHRFRWIRVTPDLPGWSAWYSQHEVYFLFNLARRSNQMKIAVYIDLVQSSTQNTYDALSGFFYPIGGIVKAGPFVGLSAEAQVADLRFVFSLDHLDSLWNPQRPQIIRGYPQYDYSLRIRLLWRFLN